MMELKVYPVDDPAVDREEVLKLYEESFPANERMDFDLVARTGEKEGMQVFYDEKGLAALAVTLTVEDMTHIIYLVVKPDQQDHGYGSAILKILKEQNPSQKLMADVEKEVDGALNNEQRSRRKEFYYRNGYHLSSVSYRWQDEEYEILVSGGEVTRKEFWHFWEEVTKRPEYQ